MEEFGNCSVSQIPKIYNSCFTNTSRFRMATFEAVLSKPSRLKLMYVSCAVCPGGTNPHLAPQPHFPKAVKGTAYQTKMDVPPRRSHRLLMKSEETLSRASGRPIVMTSMATDGNSSHLPHDRFMSVLDQKMSRNSPLFRNTRTRRNVPRQLWHRRSKKTWGSIVIIAWVCMVDPSRNEIEIPWISRRW